MSDPQALDRLRRLTGMTREAELAALRKAAEEEDAASRALAALPPAPSLEGADPVMLSAHLRWAEQERMRCNMRLARARAGLIAARQQASKAVGRNEVIARLCVLEANAQRRAWARRDGD